jgi:hypothetical protein
VRSLAGGWSFSGLSVMESGFALTAMLSATYAGLASRPNLIAPVQITGNPHAWVNPNSFQQRLCIGAITRKIGRLQIADQLSISEETVKSHVTNILSKLGANDRTHAVTIGLKPGIIEQIGDIPLELQPKLLRVLQEREFERLGSTRTKKVDVRVVAATHCALEEMVVEKPGRALVAISDRENRESLVQVLAACGLELIFCSTSAKPT